MVVEVETIIIPLYVLQRKELSSDKKFEVWANLEGAIRALRNVFIKAGYPSNIYPSKIDKSRDLDEATAIFTLDSLPKDKQKFIRKEGMKVARKEAKRFGFSVAIVKFEDTSPSDSESDDEKKSSPPHSSS